MWNIEINLNSLQNNIFQNIFVDCELLFRDLFRLIIGIEINSKVTRNTLLNARKSMLIYSVDETLNHLTTIEAARVTRRLFT